MIAGILLMSSILAERHRNGDGEEWTLNTRQTASEPLPASVLFALGWSWSLLMLNGGWMVRDIASVDRSQQEMSTRTYLCQA